MSPTLNNLPPEILFNILSFTSPFSTILLPNHPLYTFAATSKYLCDIAEEYSRSLLKRHAKLTPPKSSRANHSSCRRRWLRWVNEKCQLCRRTSRRKAILEPGLTCCADCDRKYYPKMTQTQARASHRLSKLDLFTPNQLHPTLPPLKLNTYKCMGGEALMLSETSVLDRKAHIYGLLGDQKAADPAYLSRRVRAHNRLIEHMGMVFRVRNGVGKWLVRPSSRDAGDHGEAEARMPKSMATVEARTQYVMAHLEKEWEAMGMPIPGRGERTVIEID